MFAWSEERQMERGLIAQYEEDMSRIFAGMTKDNLPVAKALAELPQDIRGFGPVKAQAVKEMRKKRDTLMLRLGGVAVVGQAAE